jgi:hypothetical protein
LVTDERNNDVGKHSEEAAEKRGVWLRWHNGADVGSTPGFRYGGKAAQTAAVTDERMR